MPTVTLSADDIAAALHLATDRLVDSLRNGRRDAVWEKSDTLAELQPHFIGACGELAVAKLLWLYPRFGVRQFSGGQADLKAAPDGVDIEVRARTKPSYELKVTKKDVPERAYVLVRGLPPTLDVVGWAWGCDVMKAEYLRDFGNRGVEAYFVPDKELRPMEELR